MSIKTAFIYKLLQEFIESKSVIPVILNINQLEAYSGKDEIYRKVLENLIRRMYSQLKDDSRIGPKLQEGLKYTRKYVEIIDQLKKLKVPN